MCNHWNVVRGISYLQSLTEYSLCAAAVSAANDVVSVVSEHTSSKAGSVCFGELMFINMPYFL